MTSTPNSEGPNNANTGGRFCPQCGLRTSSETCPEHGIPTLARVAGSGDSVQIGEIIGGRYRVEKLLGRGGFGAVYLTTHVTLQQQHVLKVLKSTLAGDETQVKRFHQEARIACKLTHPNTVRVYDFGQTESGFLYLAMELLHGQELGMVLLDEITLTPERTIRIAMGVLKSLDEAHQAGLVHRDLKPDNIFLCHIHGEDDFVKVIDFGIAKPIDQSDDAALTRTGFTVGTPKYMSPEQVLNKGVDGRSDLYSLGVILYQCLSGELPILAASSVETMMAHVQQPPRPLAEVCMQPLPDGLERLVMRALRKDPNARFADAEDMLAELEDIVEKNGLVLLRRARSAKLRAVTPSELVSSPDLAVHGPDLTVRSPDLTVPARPSVNEEATQAFAMPPVSTGNTTTTPHAHTPYDPDEAAPEATTAEPTPPPPSPPEPAPAQRTLVEPQPHLASTVVAATPPAPPAPPAPTQARTSAGKPSQARQSQANLTPAKAPASSGIPGWAIVVGFAAVGALAAWIALQFVGPAPAPAAPVPVAAPAVPAPSAPLAPAPAAPAREAPAPAPAVPPAAPDPTPAPAPAPAPTAAPTPDPAPAEAPARPAAKAKRAGKPAVDGDKAL